MSASWISIYREITDEDTVAAYAELAGPALQAAGGTFVVRGLPEQTYEAGLAALDGGAVRDMRVVLGAE